MKRLWPWIVFIVGAVPVVVTIQASYSLENWQFHAVVLSMVLFWFSGYVMGAQDERKLIERYGVVLKESEDT